MKKKYSLENLECAHCAAKMEEAIKRIDGVNDASISFLTQKLTIDAEDTVFDEVLGKAAEACHRIEPNCIIKV